MGVSAHRRAVALTAIAVAAAAATPARADYKPGIPPAVDPGTPVFTGSEQPVPAEPAAFEPGKSRLEAIYQADLAAGGTSFWIDRVLERPFLSNQDSYLYTRGRALYMYTHNAGVLGFGQRLRVPRASDGRQPDAVLDHDPRCHVHGDDRGAPPVPQPLALDPHRGGTQRRPAQVHHAQQRRGDRSDGHEHRRGVNHAHSDRRVAGGHDFGGARDGTDGRGHGPLRSHHDHAAAQRRELHRQRHVADP